ncbi:15891_t:CDS:1, partial [Acaulospora colombiana]
MRFMCFVKKKRRRGHKKRENPRDLQYENIVANEEQVHTSSSRLTETPHHDSEQKWKVELNSDGVTDSNNKVDTCRLEVPKHFAPWIESVKRIIKEITSIYTNAQYNQKTCLVL